MSDVEHFFHLFISHLHVFFGEMSRFSAHFLIGLFVFLILSCMNCLSFLEVYPLSVVSVAVVFSDSEGWVFTLLIVFLHCAKAFKFN